MSLRSQSVRSCTFSISTCLRRAALICILPWMGAFSVTSAAILTEPVSQSFSPIKLRGYGTLSGMEWKKPTGSVLEIDCESTEKASLVQAKYLSDLQVLPGVTQKVLNGATLFTVDGQGCVAAYCNQMQVVILSAASEQDLSSLIQQVKPTGPTTAQVPVPMFLDRWDKFSFRHYYSPWDTSKGSNADNYDYVADFAWAQKEDRAGILISQSRMPTDTADEMLNTGWNDYVVHEALTHDLPIDVHLGAGAGGDPSWLINRYRDQIQEKMPGFTGNFHALMTPYLGGQGVIAWNSTTGQDDTLGLLQSAVKRFASQPNVTSYLEPHGETHHGPQDIFLEYGPVVDAGYREFLKQKYQTVEAVAKRWNKQIDSWASIRVPEIASFTGWGPQAFVIDGQWRIGYPDLTEAYKDPYENSKYTARAKPSPEEWFKPGFDDSKWPLVRAGMDKQEFLQKRPAVYRQAINLPAGWKNKNPRVWLYEWDMNLQPHAEVKIVFNGKEVGSSQVTGNNPHWSAVEVTSVLKPSDNMLAIGVPQGYIGYKVYLSPTPPRQYPDLGVALNAQWVDFTDFTQWSRTQAIRRGMEMIRQADPNPGITMMHPDEYTDGLKALAVAYGGEFHNTGYMGGFYADYNTTMMRGADLPYSIEPGSPAADLSEWKNQMGLYQTEGVQAIDYFISMGSILYHPDIKADYEAHRRQISLMGQSHIPKAQIALLFSDRVAALMAYPWQLDPNTGISGGYWKWNVGSLLRGQVPYDSISQSSFANGEANPYQVVIDTNTSMMDPAMVADIEKWVRNGGTFVTLVQTGRSTPEQADSWPIASLTGYKVTHIDRIRYEGTKGESGTLKAAADQKVFGSNLDGVTANGLHLQKTAADAQNLLLWNDGSVAAGVRPLGRGFVVDLGAKFTPTDISDRINPGDETPESAHLRDLLMSVINWRNIAPEPAHLTAENAFVILRHNVTNNGLYDTWTLFNQDKKDAQTVSVEVVNKQTPAFVIDALDMQKVTGTPLQNIRLEPQQTRVFLTPRQQLPEAPLAWFDLQRKWWRGTTAPREKALPQPTPHIAQDLSADWKFKTLDSSADATALLAKDLDDSSWQSRTLGVWDVKDAGGKNHAVFRKSFTVPTQWNNGRVSIWATSWNQSSFVDQARIWLDGAEVKSMSSGNYIGENLPALKAGTSHTLAVEAQGAGVLVGLRGKCWIAYEATPQQKIDLTGEWAPSFDGLNYQTPIAFPGKFKGLFFKRSIFVDDKFKDKTAAITVDADKSLICVLVNGHLVRRHHHMIGDRGTLNITPYLKYGEKNEIELGRWDGPGTGSVKAVFLGFFDSSPF